MATRSIIAAEFNQENGGGVVATYCHYDGYLEGVGTTLLRNFNDEESAFTLADLGYLSSLHDSMKANLDPDQHVNKDDPSYFDSETDLEANMTNFGAEFVYLFKDGKWFVFDRYSNPNWVVLSSTKAAKTH